MKFLRALFLFTLEIVTIPIKLLFVIGAFVSSVHATTTRVLTAKECWDEFCSGVREGFAKDVYFVKYGRFY